MLFRLVRPMRRDGSRNIHFVQRIPKDLRPRLIGTAVEVPVGDAFVPVRISEGTQAIRCSLRTADPTVAKQRQAEAARHVESLFSALRSSAPTSLTHRQCVALSGEVYRAWAADRERFRTNSIELLPDGTWLLGKEDDAEIEALASQEVANGLDEQESEDLEATVGPLIDRVLARSGLMTVDAKSRGMLREEFRRALKDGLEAFSRKAESDYSPHPAAQRFPDFTPGCAPPPPLDRRDAGLPFDDLLGGWIKEAKATGRKPSTLESYERTIRVFRTFVEHDDACLVTPADIIRFKNQRLSEGVSPKTVKDSDLAALKTVFGWGKANLKLKSNPAEGITLKVGSKPRLRSPGFTDAEAKAILTKAIDYRRGLRESHQIAAAKRWVPWLCAFTGARLGEIVQLRKQDVQREGEHWVIRITPEAGTVKTNEAREVPLHSQLVEMGFPDFVQRCADGPLFMSATDDTPDGWRGAWRTAKNRVTEFVKGTLGNAKVAPNHGWRHRFKTIAIEQGVSERVIDALLGHKPTRVADTYGEVTLAARAKAIELLPAVAHPMR